MLTANGGLLQQTVETKRKFWYYNNHLLINNKAKGASLVTCTAQTLKTFEFEKNLQV